MKLLAAIYNKNTLLKVACLIDAAVLMMPNHSLVYEFNFDIDEAIGICKANNIQPIICINKIYLEDELRSLVEIIDKYQDYEFMISDLGIIKLFKDRGMINKVIYDSSTMVCNSLDLEIYSSLNMSAISMSNEIPVSDVIKGYNDTKANILYQVFGRKLMFYSKRKLVSCYEDHRKISIPHEDLYIKEEKRAELMPIYENSEGYTVYRSYYISLLKEIHNLNFLKYAYIETLTLSNTVLEKVLNIYKRVIKNKLDVIEGLKELDALKLNIQDGFSYLDTIHVKEKIINEKN